MSLPPNLDHLQQVEELNRAFLAFLRSRVREQLDCLGLPAAARCVMRAATDELLDAAAAFPQALFRLRVKPPVDCAAPEAGVVGTDSALHEMCSPILWAARYTSRLSPYQGRLLFGLQTAEIQWLRALPLAELQQLSWAPGVLHCAFTDKAWLWQRLLTPARPEVRRALTLLALQPGIDRDWPQRRPAHPAA